MKTFLLPLEKVGFAIAIIFFCIVLANTVDALSRNPEQLESLNNSRFCQIVEF